MGKFEIGDCIAPKDATHYDRKAGGNRVCWYKKDNGVWHFMYSDSEHWVGKEGGEPPYQTPLTEIKRQFTKHDLKDGMRVEHGDGTETIVVGDDFLVLKSDYYEKRSRHVDLSDYNEDITVISSYSKKTRDAYDIMKVTDRDGTVLFEREEEPRELTIQEIADKFGVDVKNIRIKE